LHGRPLVTVGLWGRAELVRAEQVSGLAFPPIRGAPNQGHSRTPAKGPRCSTWPTLPFGSAASVLPSCCTDQGSALAVFRETAGRSRVVRFFHAAVPHRDSPNSFHRSKSPAIEQGSLPFLGCQAAGPRLSVSRRTRGTGNTHVTSCVLCPSLARCACPRQRQTTFPARALQSND